NIGHESRHRVAPDSQVAVRNPMRAASATEGPQARRDAAPDLGASGMIEQTSGSRASHQGHRTRPAPSREQPGSPETPPRSSPFPRQVHRACWHARCMGCYGGRCGQSAFFVAPAEESTMKRILAAILILSISSLGLVGCGETSSTKTETTTKGPGGTTTKTAETKGKQSGPKPPSHTD